MLDILSFNEYIKSFTWIRNYINVILYHAILYYIILQFNIDWKYFD